MLCHISRWQWRFIIFPTTWHVLFFSTACGCHATSSISVHPLLILILVLVLVHQQPRCCNTNTSTPDERTMLHQSLCLFSNDFSSRLPRKTTVATGQFSVFVCCCKTMVHNMCDGLFYSSRCCLIDFVLSDYNTSVSCHRQNLTPIAGY